MFCVTLIGREFPPFLPLSRAKCSRRTKPFLQDALNHEIILVDAPSSYHRFLADEMRLQFDENEPGAVRRSLARLIDWAVGGASRSDDRIGPVTTIAVINSFRLKC